MAMEVYTGPTYSKIVVIHHLLFLSLANVAGIVMVAAVLMDHA